MKQTKLFLTKLCIQPNSITVSKKIKQVPHKFKTLRWLLSNTPYPDTCFQRAKIMTCVHTIYTLSVHLCHIGFNLSWYETTSCILVDGQLFLNITSSMVHFQWNFCCCTKKYIMMNTKMLLKPTYIMSALFLGYWESIVHSIQKIRTCRTYILFNHHVHIHSDFHKEPTTFYHIPSIFCK